MGKLGNTFDVDPRDDSIDKGPKPIEEFIKLQFGPKPRQCTHLNNDLTNHKHRHVAEVLRRNADLFAWKPYDLPQIGYLPLGQTSITKEKEDERWTT